MAVFGRWFGRRHADVPGVPTAAGGGRANIDMAVGARNDDTIRMTYNDKNITFNSALSDYDFDGILRDAQNNIISLFQ